MPLSARGRQVAELLAGAASGLSPGVFGCEIVRHPELCVGCGRCVSACPTGALSQDGWFDPAQLFEAPPGSRHGALGDALRRIARHPPSGPVEVPGLVRTFRSVVFAPERCLGCGACVRACPTGAVETVAVPVDEPGRWAGSEPAGVGR